MHRRMALAFFVPWLALAGLAGSVSNRPRRQVPVFQEEWPPDVRRGRVLCTGPAISPDAKLILLIDERGLIVPYPFWKKAPAYPGRSTHYLGETRARGWFWACQLLPECLRF